MFFIIEQGNRIRTPIDRVLPSPHVEQLSATSKVARISEDKESDRTAASLKPPLKHVEDTYQQASSEKAPVTSAHQIMSKPVTTALVSRSLYDIWTLFSSQSFHHLPLLDHNGLLQGIVSDRDILRFAANHGKDAGHLSIDSIMTKQVVSAAPETEIREIAEVMIGRAIGAVPIVNDNVRIEGIVTRSDILRVLVNHAPMELWV